MPQFRNAFFTKICVHMILPYVNFAQFRNAMFTTLKYVSHDFALCELFFNFETRFSLHYVFLLCCIMRFLLYFVTRVSLHYNTFLIILPYAKCSLISTRDFHYTKLVVLIILPYANFAQFRKAVLTTQTHVYHSFALC